MNGKWFGTEFPALVLTSFRSPRKAWQRTVLNDCATGNSDWSGWWFLCFRWKATRILCTCGACSFKDRLSDLCSFIQFHSTTSRISRRLEVSRSADQSTERFLLPCLCLWPWPSSYKDRSSMVHTPDNTRVNRNSGGYRAGLTFCLRATL
jgi:hypothetical protein